jgi:hypothetical protein
MRRLWKLLGLLLVCWGAGVLAAPAGYAIDWWTIDGGGGMSSGGSYTLSGTIGQPDAGSASGGGYTLAGGFWEGSTGQTKVYLPIVAAKGNF